MQIGVILGDVHGSVSPRDHLDGLLRQVDAAQRNGVRHITMGQHFLYGDLRWLQPIPTLARIAAELDEDVTLATTVVQVPLYHPVMLAEDLATLDILTRGKLVVGAGAGYREDEFTALGVDFSQRFAMFDEAIALMKSTWTDEVVDFRGKFWTVEDGHPHIRPWQDPHPPIWIGALKDHGVRRSARLGDGWPITPETRLPEMVRLLSIYEDERERLGRPQVKHPLRREIIPAPTTDAAFDRFEKMAKDRLLAYANRQLATRDANEISREFREVARKETFIGTPDECVAQISEMAAVAPIDTILVRAQWPHMSSDEVVAYLDDLGRDIVPAVRDIKSVDRVVRD
ncbi:LLM class flavin-dependent oxidoreductase [Nocardioides sp. TF02-7]|uniref:LLM class flavin-dependent oxidoreductase n=1 Tax=Nocardioides sp. TF02-7 TaxID=2917724 RepID=UPI001F05B288|nr:LLM class flavin-dependent oxidoreductase [Nocardioides sp. TF02-7]UMG91206.1 LLM class flavin-dependent oxidoreductase [Nocardioides sp. TF02-7]